jgi:DNA polymerase-1
MTEKRLVLIDSYALIYRSYYAFINTPMYSSKGLNTSTIFGFLLTIDDILRKQKPTHIAAAFDTSAPTFRHEMYAEYKANRQITPDEIRNSVPIIKQILRLMNIEILELPGFEADDVIGTIAKKAARNNFEVLMVTPDKDYCQLVEEHIKIYKPKKSGAEAEVLGIDEVKANFSIQSPEQVIDILALWGDASDNVPGVPGIGEKTAKKLIADYSSVENLVQNLDKLSPKQKESFTTHMDDLILSKKLVTIDIETPIAFEEEKLILKDFQEKELIEVFNELNFKSLITKFFKAPQQPASPKPSGTFQQGSLFDQPVQQSLFTPDPNEKNASNTAHSYQLINDESSIKSLIQNIEATGEFCFDTETTGLDPHIDLLVGIAFSIKPFEAYYLPVSENIAETKEKLKLLKPVFENEKIQKIGHNLKFDILFLRKYDIKVEGKLFDTMLAHYLLQPEQNHKMDNLSKKYLNYVPIPIEDLIGRKGISQLNMRQVPLDKICEYAAEDADVTFQLKNILKEEIEKSGLVNLFYNIESKLLEVLIDIELNGFTLDVQYLKEYSKFLAGEITNTETEIYNLAGQHFNIASPKQLGDILFEKLQIPYEGKLTKTKQYSTNEEVLQYLTDKHPIINQILDYRGLTKLQSTYVEALPKLVNPNTGKVHTSFNQSLAVTGRLSSNNPNLQNIPIREERGREMRKAFVPSLGNILLSADYSQIELRIMAHMSKDANMIDAFMHDADIHTSTASKVFKIPVEEVTKEQRSKAKTANFGIIYGISAFGLAQRMNIPRKEAMDLIAEYFKTFQGVRQYMTDIIIFAKEKGYVETLLGRRRFLPDVNSQNAVVRGMAERNAINSPIQGSAADIIKIAMINVFESFKHNNLQSKMILQVHDELIFDVVKHEEMQVKEIIKKEMENAYPLAVPLRVDMGTGNNWLEAH